MKNIIELLYENYLNNGLATAIKDSDKEINYKELFLEVLDKANCINELGIFHQPILVKVNRSIDSVVAFFAVLLRCYFDFVCFAVLKSVTVLMSAGFCCCFLC